MAMHSGKRSIDNLYYPDLPPNTIEKSTNESERELKITTIILIDNGSCIVEPSQTMTIGDDDVDTASVQRFALNEPSQPIAQESISTFHNQNNQSLGLLSVLPVEVLRKIFKRAGAKSLMVLNQAGYTLATGYKSERKFLEGIGQFNLVLMWQTKDQNQKPYQIKRSDLAVFVEGEKLFCQVHNKPKAEICFNASGLSYVVDGKILLANGYTASEEDQESYKRILATMKGEPENSSVIVIDKDYLFKWSLSCGYARCDRLPDYNDALLSNCCTGFFGHVSDGGWVKKENTKIEMYSVFWYSILKAFFVDLNNEPLNHLIGTNIWEFVIPDDEKIESLAKILPKTKVKKLQILVCKKLTKEVLEPILANPAIKHVVFENYWRDEELCQDLIVEYCPSLRDKEHIAQVELSVEKSTLEKIADNIALSSVRILNLCPIIELQEFSMKDIKNFEEAVRDRRKKSEGPSFKVTIPSDYKPNAEGWLEFCPIKDGYINDHNG